MYLSLMTIHDTSFAASSVNTQAETEYSRIKAKKEEIIALETMQIRPCAGTYHLSSSESDYYKNQEMYSSFYADLEDNFIGSKMSGQSKAVWLGNNPFNADKISLSTEIKLTGIAISVSVGNDGFEVSGGSTSKTLNMFDSIEDNWRLYQNYSNVTFDGIDLYYRHSAIGKFEFGYEIYYLTATDSVWP